MRVAEVGAVGNLKSREQELASLGSGRPLTAAFAKLYFRELNKFNFCDNTITCCLCQADIFFLVARP